MMYLLTEEEYSVLTSKKELLEDDLLEKLQTFCTDVSDRMPVKWTWGEGKDHPKPWGCIITARKKRQEWYCDQCPARDICPYENKEWSK